MENKRTAQRAFDALDFSIGAQWFKDWTNGNNDVSAIVSDDESEFTLLKFKGEPRFLGMVHIGPDVDLSNASSDSKEIKEFQESLAHTTANSIAQAYDYGKFGYNYDFAIFYDLVDNVKHFWGIVHIQDIEREED